MAVLAATLLRLRLSAMRPANTDNSERHPLTCSHLRVAIVATVLVAALAGAVGAPAQDLQSQADAKRANLDDAKSEKGVLSSQISQLDSKISDLTGQVAALRNREARVEAELAEAQDQLDTEQENLEVLRERLDRTVKNLEKRLVEIYKSDEPDALSVILDADGFENVLGESEYLQRIQAQDSNIVTQVRTLRDDTRETVARVRSTRDAIAAKQRELQRTREALEAREAELQQAQAQSQTQLKQVKVKVADLEGELSDIEGKIQRQLAAAAAAQDSAETPATLPAGPVQGASGGYIWPVNGPVVSPFGPRWGTLHAGIDIAASAGTPIRAVKDGQIAFVQSDAASGGYGNYTCINHGGGLSSCYAHQSSFAITSGSVNQGDVIGYVGCTGHCYGDHLHFEIRVNGVPTDPLAYL